MHRGTHRQWDHTASTKYLFRDAKNFTNQTGICISQVLKIQVPTNVFFCLRGLLTGRTELLLFIKSKQTAVLNHGDAQTDTSPQTEAHKSFLLAQSLNSLTSTVSYHLRSQTSQIDPWHFPITGSAAAISYISCQESISSETQKKSLTSCKSSSHGVLLFTCVDVNIVYDLL